MRTLARSAALIGIIWLASPYPAAADALQDCAEMLQHTGAPSQARDRHLEVPLCRKGYVLSYNKWHRVPSWVIEVLTAERLRKKVDREDSEFKEDEESGKDAMARLEDYAGSGFDRGHMAPAGDMVWDQEAMEQSFLLSNMAPQIGIGFNRHIWSYLERYARDLVSGRDPIVVITGAAFSEADAGIHKGKKVKKEQEGRDASVTIPTAFYKIIYHPARKRAIAFLIPHRKLTGEKYESFIASIDDIEKATGLDFLTALSKRDQQRIERVKALRWREYEGS